MLENQVCSLELSKRLKELGVKQESYFEWLSYPATMEWKVSPRFKTQLGYAAFTVAELGEMLPDNCYTQKDHGTLPIKWICHRIIDADQEDVWIAETEANARAMCLIYLLENNLMELNA